MRLVDKETWHDDELLRDIEDDARQEDDDFTSWLDRRNEKETDLVEKW
jgi:hypothetical protein